MKSNNKKKAQRRKVNFANAIISVCVAVALFVTVAVIYEYHRLNTVIPSNVISSLFTLWGGELLIVALRQIFGSDVIKMKKQITEKTEENESDIFGGTI